jgi:hypothetical protein
VGYDSISTAWSVSGLLPRRQSNEIQREKFYLLMGSGSHIGQKPFSTGEAAFVFVYIIFVEASKSNGLR